MSRVSIRRPTAADENEYLALLKSSVKFHAPWFPERDSSAFESSAFRTFLKTDNGERCVRFLICRSEDGAILGVINISEIVRGVFQSAYLGYWIGSDLGGQGYMKEALALVIAYGFGELGLHRLEANIIPDNSSSIGVVRALGFSREGYSPKYLKIAGEWHDHERWAILAKSSEPR